MSKPSTRIATGPLSDHTGAFAAATTICFAQSADHFTRNFLSLALVLGDREQILGESNMREAILFFFRRG